MAVKITCINKSGGYHADPHHAISHLGWKNETTGETGKSTRLEVYEWIKDKGGSRLRHRLSWQQGTSRNPRTL